MLGVFSSDLNRRDSAEDVLGADIGHGAGESLC